ncbi:MAG: Hsp33 family molecular chaperone HslO, partial [Mycoplasmatales bacterium]|nr:Hsp33 family molecular chaperone HslO [Mycoplasmatales bacterium]
MKRHQTKPLASLALSTAIAVFGPLSTMKKEGRVVAFYKFDGALKNLLVESNVQGDVRALVGDPFVTTDFDNKDVNQIPIKVGLGEKGTLRIVNETNNNQWGGEVEMAKGDITTDLAFYFDQSEQIQSAVVSDVKMKDKMTLERAYSAIFQLIPGYLEEDISWIEKFIKNNKLSENSIETYVKKLEALELETREIRWKCKCSQEKMKKLLELMSEKEKEDIKKEYGKLEVQCNFCNNIYKF